LSGPRTPTWSNTMWLAEVDEGEFTVRLGIFAGTFTQPLPIGGGVAIPPAGKSFNLRFSTIAHWTPGWGSQRGVSPVGGQTSC
jgi:hypothetical protein